MITLISSGKNEMPDSLAGLAASAAIAVSNVPFNGPISEVGVARIKGYLYSIHQQNNWLKPILISWLVHRTTTS